MKSTKIGTFGGYELLAGRLQIILQCKSIYDEIYRYGERQTSLLGRWNFLPQPLKKILG